MTTIIMFIILGLLLFFVAPPLMDQQWTKLRMPVRVFGVFMIAFGIAITSYIHIDSDATGILKRVYLADDLPEGSIIALNGEKGPQAQILGPGFHFRLFLNVLYDVEEESVVDIPAGKLAFLTATDGAPLRPEQTYADPFDVLLEEDTKEVVDFKKMVSDARYALINGLQKGPQTSVLRPGKHRLNTYLWKVEIVDATTVDQGFVGVIKSNVHASVRYGNLATEKPKSCKPVQLDRPADSLKTQLVPVGCIGIWEHSLTPGQFYINPRAYTVTMVDTRAQAWRYIGGYTHRNIILKLNPNGEFEQSEVSKEIALVENSAGPAFAFKAQGWRMHQSLRIIARVTARDAPFVIASVGGLQEVEDRIIAPAAQSWLTNLAGGTILVPKEDGSGDLEERQTRVLDFMEHRARIENQLEGLLVTEGKKAGATLKEVRLLEPYFPPELLLPRKRTQLASELVASFKQEQIAQRARIETEKTQARANEQARFVKAEIDKLAAKEKAEERRFLGLGARHELEELAEGQKAQVAALGTQAVLTLRIVDKFFAFAENNPDVIKSMLDNAHKFVPSTVVSSNGAGLSGMAAILGAALSQKPSQIVEPTAAEKSPRN